MGDVIGVDLVLIYVLGVEWYGYFFVCGKYDCVVVVVYFWNYFVDYVFVGLFWCLLLVVDVCIDFVCGCSLDVVFVLIGVWYCVVCVGLGIGVDDWWIIYMVIVFVGYVIGGGVGGKLFLCI